MKKKVYLSNKFKMLMAGRRINWVDFSKRLKMFKREQKYGITREERELYKRHQEETKKLEQKLLLN